MSTIQQGVTFTPEKVVDLDELEKSRGLNTQENTEVVSDSESPEDIDNDAVAVIQYYLGDTPPSLNITAHRIDHQKPQACPS